MQSREAMPPKVGIGSADGVVEGKKALHISEGSVSLPGAKLSAMSDTVPLLKG